jgi:hypothetical protein
MNACFDSRIDSLGSENNIANANDYQVRFSNILDIQPLSKSAKAILCPLLQAFVPA